MKPNIESDAFVLLAVAGLLASGCECSERPLHELDAMDAGAESTTGETQAGSAEGAAAATGGTEGSSTGEVIDVTPFLGVFHAEHWVTPFGHEVPNPGGVALANLEIRADGTASMIWETCSLLAGTREVGWTWEAHPGPVLEFSPGSGEDSLDYFALTDLVSLRAYFVDDCGFQFEADGDLITTQTFRPGLACWVNRCEPSWTVHLDYCEGEDPPPCE